MPAAATRRRPTPAPDPTEVGAINREIEAATTRRNDAAAQGADIEVAQLDRRLAELREQHRRALRANRTEAQEQEVTTIRARIAAIGDPRAEVVAADEARKAMIRRREDLEKSLKQLEYAIADAACKFQAAQATAGKLGDERAELERRLQELGEPVAAAA